DSLLLLKTNERSAQHLQHILTLYEVCSGQTINKEKSSVMFNKNIGATARHQFMSTTSINIKAWNEKYLSLMVYMGKSKKHTFSYLKDKVWQKTEGWKEKLLSKALLVPASAATGSFPQRSAASSPRTHSPKQAVSKAGKEVLIKAVAHAIPTYAMSCFDLTKVEKPEISSSWCSILRGVQALKDGLIWRVGDGTNIQIWSDPWIPNVITRHPCTPRGRTILSRVSELIDPTTRSWDKELVNDVFWEEDAKNTLAIPIMPHMEDTIACHSSQHTMKNENIFFKRVNQVLHQNWMEFLIGEKFGLLMLCQRQTSTKEEYRWILAALFVRKWMRMATIAFLNCWRMMCLEHARTSLLEATTSPNDVLNIIALLWAWWDARNKTNAEEQRMVCKSQKIGGWGFFIKNHDGEGVLADARHLQDVSDVLCTVAHACLVALDVVVEHGISRVILKTGSISLRLIKRQVEFFS
ncbi:hypothetical protein U9M48_025887, partial [Paspalum notatum var. saurae]